MNPIAHRINMKTLLIWLWHWLPPLIVMAVIFYLSAQRSLPQAPGYWLDAVLKKLCHAIEYAILFLLLFRAWRCGRTTDQALCTSLLATAAYALSDELHQAFVPGRSANWYDVLIDLSGVLLLWRLLRSGCWRGLLRGQDKDLAE